MPHSVSKCDKIDLTGKQQLGRPEMDYEFKIWIKVFGRKITIFSLSFSIDD